MANPGLLTAEGHSVNEVNVAMDAVCYTVNVLAREEHKALSTQWS